MRDGIIKRVKEEKETNNVLANLSANRTNAHFQRALFLIFYVIREKIILEQ
jgi:hypothetical protein